MQAKNLLVYLQHCLGEKENSREKRIQESAILDREQDAGQHTIFATKQYSYLQSASYLLGTFTGIPIFLNLRITMIIQKLSINGPNFIVQGTEPQKVKNPFKMRELQVHPDGSDFKAWALVNRPPNLVFASVAKYVKTHFLASHSRLSHKMIILVQYFSLRAVVRFKKLYIFLLRGSQSVRESLIGCLLHAPQWGWSS